MNSKVVHLHPKKGECQWCSSQINQIEKMKLCNDQICNQCSIENCKSKSTCPICWEKSISRYLIFHRICSVCCKKLKENDKTLQCTKQHIYCSECLPNGCNLCLFGQLQQPNKNFDEISSILKRSFYHCSQWQIKAEENPSPFNTPRSQSLKTKSDISSEKTEDEDDTCIICREDLNENPYRKLEHCGHKFHDICIEGWFQSSGKQSCPTCGYVYGISKGPQPSNGKMQINFIATVLPGFENENYKNKKETTIEIVYVFPNGIQGPLNPKPGKPFTGTTRRAYFPNNKEGRDILKLLKKAFDDQHVFTVGKSVTSGQENVVTWNDIHHKTSIYGGPQSFGYPDPTYLFRIRQELADKGYK